MENAATRMVRGQDPIRHHVRRQMRQSLMANPAPHTRFLTVPVAVRRIIYTTNAIESLNAKLRRAVRTRGHFPTDEAAIKLLYLVLRQVARHGKCRHANGARPRPNSPSCSTTDSSKLDG